MKHFYISAWWIFLCGILFISCSTDSSEEIEVTNLRSEVALVDYTDLEIDILELVNDYRSQQGLSVLAYLDECSVQAVNHNEHMIIHKEVCHDNLTGRFQALVSKEGAKAVSENVAYGYQSAQSVVEAWINSTGHRENLEGEYTHFGISAKKDAAGKRYFTNIFIKK